MQTIEELFTDIDSFLLQVAVGKDHAIIISQECMIFTYGRGTEGQLGHGDDKSRATPVLVEALKGKSVYK